MSHYKNLAAVAFRVVGLSVMLYALVAWGYSLLTSRYTGASPLAATLVVLVYFVLGLLLFTLSKLLASLVAKGLDNN